MDKTDLSDWKNNPITKAFFDSISEEITEARTQSNIRATVDETAIQTAYNEGFISGMNSINEAIEDMELFNE